MPQNIHVKGYGNYWFPDDMSDRDIQEYIDTELRRQRQEKVSYGTVPDALMGAVRGAAETIGGSGARLAEKVGWGSMADFIREGVEADREKLLGVGPTMPQNKAADIGSMLGGTAAYYGTGLLTGGLGTAVLGAGSGLEEQRQRQLAAKMAGYDVSDSDSLWSELGGAALGATEALPVGRWVGKLGRLAGPVGKTTIEAADELLKRGGVRGYGTAALLQGAEEAAQEVGAGLGQNALTRLYKEDQDLWEGTGEGGLAGGLMGALMGAGQHGYNRRAASRRQADIDEYRKSQLAPAEEAAPAQPLSSQLGLFTGQPEAQPQLRAMPASDMADLYGGDIAEATEEDPYGLRALLAPVTPGPAASEPPWEQRKSRLTEESAGPLFANLDQDEAKIGDTLLEFESPLDRAAWMGQRDELGERRKDHLAVVADALGGHTGEAWQLGRRVNDVIGSVLKKAGDNQPGALVVAKMITPDIDGPKFTPIPPYRPQARGAQLPSPEQMTMPAGTPGPETARLAMTEWEKENHDYAKKHVASLKPAQNLYLGMVQAIPTPTGENAEARWDASRKAIEVAFIRPEKGEKPEAWKARMQSHIAGVLDHEFVHYLKANKVFDPRQWKALTRQAQKRGLVAEAQKLYGNQPNYSAEMMEEEGVANMMRDTANIRPGSFVYQMWQRVMNSFKAAGNGLIGRGWYTADDVMGAIRAGQVAQQTPQTDLRLAQVRSALAQAQAAPATTEAGARARALAAEVLRPQQGETAEDFNRLMLQARPPDAGPVPKGMPSAAESAAVFEQQLPPVPPAPPAPVPGRAEQSARTFEEEFARQAATDAGPVPKGPLSRAQESAAAFEAQLPPIPPPGPAEQSAAAMESEFARQARRQADEARRQELREQRVTGVPEYGPTNMSSG